MKIIAFDHIQFIVKNLDESITFFDKLGFKLETQTTHHGGSAEMRMHEGGPIFEIHAIESMENPGHDHYALYVDDLDVAIEELREKGIEISDPTEVAVTRRRIANFRDPTGFRWQLVGPKK